MELDRYDDQIKQSVRKYWGHFPQWQFWKAQLYQESVFDPEAVSPVGAAGLAQFMPATWDQISRELGLGNVSPHDSRLAITAGAYYMAKLSSSWTARRTDLDRHRLAMASYNAGMGNILKAQRACGGRNSYRGIIACLPQITGHHSEETITYVERIEDYSFRLYFRTGLPLREDAGPANGGGASERSRCGAAPCDEVYVALEVPSQRDREPKESSQSAGAVHSLSRDRALAHSRRTQGVRSCSAS